MDLSPRFQATHTAFSRVKRLLAASTKDRLVIRTADSLQVLHSIKLAEPLSSLAFSASAQHLLAVTSAGVVSVYDCDSAERQIVSTASAGEGTAASWLTSACGFFRLLLFPMLIYLALGFSDSSEYGTILSETSLSTP